MPACRFRLPLGDGIAFGSGGCNGFTGGELRAAFAYDAVTASIRAAFAARDLNAHYGVMATIHMLCAGGSSCANNAERMGAAGAVEALAESARGLCSEARGAIIWWRLISLAHLLLTSSSPAV